MSAEDVAVKQRLGATALNFAAIGGVTEIAKSSAVVLLGDPIEELDPINTNHGVIFLTACIMDEFYDIALDLLQRYRQPKTLIKTTLQILAQKPSAFPSGTQLSFWLRWTYKCWYSLNPEKASLIVSGDIERPHWGAPHRRSFTKRVRHQLAKIFWKGLKPSALVKKSLFEAIKQGIVEFVTEIMKHYPEVAAFLAPSSLLDRVSGAALQMQRELQWFKEVERVVQPKYKEMINNHFKTPRALFSDHHKKLVEQGEQWTKDTTESCTVVTALIVAIMFSAVFTAPGGYHNSGVPIYLNRNSSLVYIISDALSLFSSTTSLLMFLGILTSRYREEDFLTTVPTKLMAGLSILFFSLATMMISFGVALHIVLRERIAWVSFPISLLASMPITLFALLQFPLVWRFSFLLMDLESLTSRRRNCVDRVLPDLRRVAFVSCQATLLWAFISMYE
ncbi:Ankyrin repeat family protein isoform 3 [Hibiscus syriacus]|uniref:Ankyrin repeat family protein isoform 3 n=1 Tax=Hibiscus syriacus TaxID=106335 RepID=A0A6A3AZQ3_HIBSY|nr:Ankyrin repeat family protein isoform 3 [Hibiscus syriacus]